MKTTIFKISSFVLLFALMGTGCEKDEDLSYLDNSKVFDIGLTGFSIYKAKKDYFFNVPVRPYGDSFHSLVLSEESAQINMYKGKYYFNERFRLYDNYTISTWIDSDYYFTSLNFDTYIKEKLSPVYNQGITNPKVINSIIDRDPYTEFYRPKMPVDGKTSFTVAEINQLIREKNLEKYFTKIK